MKVSTTFRWPSGKTTVGEVNLSELSALGQFVAHAETALGKGAVITMQKAEPFLVRLRTEKECMDFMAERVNPEGRRRKS